MNVALLDTLIQLFASIAKEDGITEMEKKVVKTFLSQQFNDTIAQEYLKVFLSYSENEDIPDVKDLCIRVNNELTYEQKLFILVRLIELAFADGNISLTEVKNILIAAKYFNIDYKEYQNVFNFITTRNPAKLQLKNVLYITSDPDIGAEYVIHSENLNGYIAVLLISSANIYILRYLGNSDVYLNGQILQPELVYFLNPGSVIRAPRLDPIYYSDVVDRYLHSSRKFKITFYAKDVVFRFPNGKIGLHGVNIYEESGKMVAFMGASGAGKSTLLNVLNGNYIPSSGSVTINGIDIHLNPKGVEGVIGFVSQDDLLIEELSVYENLFFNAKLCFDNLSDKQIDEIVSETLSELGLYEIKDLKVGNSLNKMISGGQRKRLNIALELIREPAVLFVDEPTSGLSSRDSENVMDLLKELANKGKLIFVVIHQPSSDIFKLFDRLYILDTGGYPVFYGNPLEGIRYFRREQNYVNADSVECHECGNVNPEQIFNIIEAKVVDEYGKMTNVRKVAPTNWNETFLKNASAISDANRATKPPEAHLKLPSRFKQFRIFAERDMLSKLANRAFMAVSLLEAPVLAFILAFILKSYKIEENGEFNYYLFHNQDLPAYLFVSILVALFIGLTVSSEEILRDRKIRKRESFLHLSLHSYLTSKMAVLFIISAVQMLCFVLVGNFIVGINELHFYHWVTLFSVACFANMLGLNISATFDSAVTIYIVVPLMLIPQIILSGVLVDFNKLNPLFRNVESVPICGDVMVSRWSYEALAVCQFKDNRYERRFYDLDKAIVNARYKASYWVPEMESVLDYCINHYKDRSDVVKVEQELAILRNELEKETKQYKNPRESNLIRKLNPTRFNEYVGNEVARLIKRLNIKYNREYENAVKNKELVIKFYQFHKINLEQDKLLHNNESLRDLVSNANSSERLIKFNGQLIRQLDPVYLDPSPDRFFLNYRTHFYAPRKYLLGTYFDTFWFNMSIIWLFSAVLYVTLYFEAFRKLIEYGGVIYQKIEDRIVARKQLQ